MSDLKLSITGKTVKGIRESNQDTISISGWQSSAENGEIIELVTSLDSPTLSLVADGMGGHAAGEIASREVAFHLNQNLVRLFQDKEQLVLVLSEAHDRLRYLMDLDPDYEGMGTTIAGLAIQGGNAIVFNVGDSPVYEFRDNQIREVSENHSAGGAIGSSHELTRALGGNGTKAPKPYVSSILDMKLGQKFLICSDGVSDYLETAQLEYLFRSEQDDRVLVEELIAFALERGGEDNLSAVIVSPVLSSRSADKPIVPSPSLGRAIDEGARRDVASAPLAPVEHQPLESSPAIDPVLDRSLIATGALACVLFGAIVALFVGPFIGFGGEATEPASTSAPTTQSVVTSASDALDGSIAITSSTASTISSLTGASSNTEETLKEPASDASTGSGAEVGSSTESSNGVPGAEVSSSELELGSPTCSLTFPEDSKSGRRKCGDGVLATTTTPGDVPFDWSVLDAQVVFTPSSNNEVKVRITQDDGQQDFASGALPISARVRSIDIFILDPEGFFTLRLIPEFEVNPASTEISYGP